MKRLVLNMVCRVETSDSGRANSDKANSGKANSGKANSGKALVYPDRREGLRASSPSGCVAGPSIPLFLREVGKYYWFYPEYEGSIEKPQSPDWALKQENHILRLGDLLITRNAVIDLEQDLCLHKFWRDTYPILKYDQHQSAIHHLDGAIEIKHDRGAVYLNSIGLHANCMGFSPDASLFVTGYTNGLIRIWDTDTGERIYVILGRTPVTSVYFFETDGWVFLASKRNNDWVHVDKLWATSP